MGGKIYDVVWVSIHTTCGMNALNQHLWHDLRFNMGLSHQGSRHLMPQQKCCNIGVSP